MTDSPTKTAERQTPHSVVMGTLSGYGMLGSVRNHVSSLIVRDLSEAGLLVSDAPTEEQIERALDSWVGGGFVSTYPESVQYWWPKMRAALTAAGVGSPVPVRKSPPVELALDLWQALGFPAGEFDGYYERNGWAGTWANLLQAPGGVNQREKCGDDSDGEPCVLRAGDHLVHYGASDVGSSEPLPSSTSPAPVQIDAAKLADKLLALMREEAMLFENGSEEWIAESDPVEVIPALGRGLSEWLRGGAQ